MPTPRQSAEYALAHPILARGRLLTASRSLAIAVQEVHQLLGYLDGGNAEARYLELGITTVESQLLRAVRALDMMPEPPARGRRS